jgi:hypothetical protein
MRMADVADRTIGRFQPGGEGACSAPIDVRAEARAHLGGALREAGVG